MAAASAMGKKFHAIMKDEGGISVGKHRSTICRIDDDVSSMALDTG